MADMYERLDMAMAENAKLRAEVVDLTSALASERVQNGKLLLRLGEAIENTKCSCAEIPEEATFHFAICPWQIKEIRNLHKTEKLNPQAPPAPGVQRDLVPPLPGGAAPVNSSCCMPHTPWMSCCCGCHSQ